MTEQGSLKNHIQFLRPSTFQIATPESSSRLLFKVFTASIAFAMRDRLNSLLLLFRG
jgi:hypothetical protein